MLTHTCAMKRALLERMLMHNPECLLQVRRRHLAVSHALRSVARRLHKVAEVPAF
jgi:hypothetical protein